MDTNLYWTLRGSYATRKYKLSTAPREYLEASILDAEYNDFLRPRSDYKDGETDIHGGHGKRLPYIGWYWRHVTFHDLTTIQIGNCGPFVGFMPNNKWDYPQRMMTEDEGKRVMEIIDEAMKIDEEGGDVAKINEKVKAKLDELWVYMQTLKI